MNSLIVISVALLAGVSAIHWPRTRSALAELALLVAISTGVGYLLMKPSHQDEIGKLLSRSTACASEAADERDGRRGKKSSKTTKADAGC